MSISHSQPYALAVNGIRLFARVTPRARRNMVQGPGVDAAGRCLLRIAVTALPNDGQANAAVIGLLSKYFKIPKTALTIVTGGGSRHKEILIKGDTGTLDRVVAVLATDHGDQE